MLTPTERTLLANLLTIRAKVCGEDLSRELEIISNGYEALYAEVISVSLDPVTREDSDFVHEVLTMFGELHRYATAHPDDASIAHSTLSQFRGFDASRERKLMSYARFLIDKQGLFPEQIPNRKATNGFDSRAPAASMYRRMLEVWREFAGRTLGRDDVIRILASTRASVRTRR